MSALKKLVSGMALAAALGAGSAFGATIPIVNASFESGPNGNQPGSVSGLRFNQLNSTAPGWDRFSSLSGWTKSGGSRLEIQSDRSAAVDAQDGDYFVSLDGGASNITISQSVTLSAGTYLLSFWYSPESSDATTNEIVYNLGPIVNRKVNVGTNGAAVGVWTEIRTRIGIVTPGTYTLSFGAGGRVDGVGGFIDNVSLITTVPVPAAGFGLLAGLGALAAVRRRRRAA